MSSHTPRGVMFSSLDKGIGRASPILGVARLPTDEDENQLFAVAYKDDKIIIYGMAADFVKVKTICCTALKDLTALCAADKTTIIAGASGGKIVVINILTDQVQELTDLHSSTICFLDVLGNCVASAGTDGFLRVSRFVDGSIVPVKSLTLQAYTTFKLVAKDGCGWVLALSQESSCLQFLHAESLTLAVEVSLKDLCNVCGPWDLAVNNATGEYGIVANDHGHLRLLAGVAGKPEIAFAGTLQSGEGEFSRPKIAFSASLPRVWVSCADGYVRCFEINAGQARLTSVTVPVAEEDATHECVITSINIFSAGNSLYLLTGDTCGLLTLSHLRK